MAPRVNALVAPVVNYGVTGSLDAFPGAFTIPEDAYRAFLGGILDGLARQGFKNIIIVNGHGGPQPAILNALADKTRRAQHLRTRVTNWRVIRSTATLNALGHDA